MTLDGNAFEVGAESTLALEAFPKARRHDALQKPRHDAAAQIDPAARVEGQGQVAGEGGRKPKNWSMAATQHAGRAIARRDPKWRCIVGAGSIPASAQLAR